MATGLPVLERERTEERDLKAYGRLGGRDEAQEMTEEQKAKAASLLGSLERLHRRLQITRWCIAMLSSNVGKKEKKVRDSRIF